MKNMKNPNLKIDYTNKTFLYQGHFYGYVKDKIIFLFWNCGSDVIPITRFKRGLFYEYDAFDIRVYMDIDITVSRCGIHESYHGYYPDIYLKSYSEKEQFIEFINYCYLNT